MLQSSLKPTGNASVAELADAPDLGSGSRKGMGVRPSPFAPPNCRAVLRLWCADRYGRRDDGASAWAVRKSRWMLRYWSPRTPRAVRVGERQRRETGAASSSAERVQSRLRAVVQGHEKHLSPGTNRIGKCWLLGRRHSDGVDRLSACPTRASRVLCICGRFPRLADSPVRP
jgi:hypothetical protein